MAWVFGHRSIPISERPGEVIFVQISIDEIDTHADRGIIKGEMGLRDIIGGNIYGLGIAACSIKDNKG